MNSKFTLLFSVALLIGIATQAQSTLCGREMANIRIDKREVAADLSDIRVDRRYSDRQAFRHDLRELRADRQNLPLDRTECRLTRFRRPC